MNVRLPKLVRAGFAQLKTEFSRVQHPLDDYVRFVGKNSLRYCPVTAVCQLLTGQHYSIDEPFQAGKAIGLSVNAINKIVLAADSSTGKQRKWLEGLLSGKSTRKHT